MTCTLVLTTNTVMVWRDGSLVGMAEEDEMGFKLTLYPIANNPVVVTACDLDIITDNWNQLQEMVMVERLKKDENFVDGDDGL